MKTERLSYALFLCFLTASVLLTEQLCFLLLLVLALILPLGLLLRLRYEAAHLSLRLCAPSSQICGQRLSLELSAVPRTRLIAAGVICLSLNTQNLFSGETQHEKLKLPLLHGTAGMTLQTEPSVCGTLHISCLQLTLCDLFGLCRIPIKQPCDTVVTIYPGERSVDLTLNEQPAGQSLSGEQIQPLRGHDFSEVFDLRDYHPGDDIRSIHWKLSSKLEQPVIRQASDTLHLQSLILFDVGVMPLSAAERSQLLTCAAELVGALSRQLTEQRMNHCVGITANDCLQLFPITNQAEYLTMLTEWMSIPAPTTAGQGLCHLLSLQSELPFTKLLYLTIGDCPEEMTRLRSTLQVTAICIQPHGEQITQIKRHHASIIHLPQNLAEEAVLHLRF